MENYKLKKWDFILGNRKLH